VKDPASVTVVPSRIIVGYDFSPLAQLALIEAALAASHRESAQIHVVNVVETASPKRISNRDSEDVDFELQERLRGDTESAIHQSGGKSEARIFAHVMHGQPAEQLLDMARYLEADLIVLGTHGHTGVKRLVLGSVAETVVRRATCPVLVTRARNYPAEPELVPDPPCEQCVAARKATDGTRWWCAEHDRPWTPPTRYHYSNGTLRPFHPDGLG